MSATSLVFKTVIIFLTICAGSCLLAGEYGNDKYLAKDWFRHFGFTVDMTTAIGFVAYNHFEAQTDDAVFIGFAASFSLGGFKEILDSTRPDRHSSLKDLAADLLGSLVGASLLAIVIK